MEKNEELIRLEQFVDNLLNKYNDLKGNFHALEATLAERDAECAGLKDDIAELRDERSDVGTRVSGLLGRIEQWESEQGTTSEQEDNNEDKQGTLFNSENPENG